MSSQGGVTQGLPAAGLRLEFRCVRHLPCSCWTVFGRDRASVAKGGVILHVCRLVPRRLEEAIFRTTVYGPLVILGMPQSKQVDQGAPDLCIHKGHGIGTQKSGQFRTWDPRLWGPSSG